MQKKEVCIINDLTYILKVCGQGLCILVSAEIAFFSLIKREGSTKSKSLSTGIFFFFLFGAMGFLFYMFELRILYFFPETDLTLIGIPRLISNLKVIMFIYAFSSFVILLGRTLTHVHFRIPFIIILAGMPLLTIAPYWVFNTVAYCFIPLGLLLFLIFLNFVEMTRGHLRWQFLSILIGFLAFFAGYVTMTHGLDPIIDFMQYPVAEPVMFFSLLCMSYGFFSIPSLTEAFALAYLEELYIVTKDGKMVLSYNFKTQEIFASSVTESAVNEPGFDEKTLASTLVGIDGLLREISESKGEVKTLRHQERTFIIEWASSLVGILKSGRELQIYRPLLSNFMRDLETRYLVEILMQKTLAPELKQAIVEIIENRFKFEVQGLGTSPPKEGVYKGFGQEMMFDHLLHKREIAPKAWFFPAIYLVLTIIQLVLLFLDLRGVPELFNTGVTDTLIYNGLFLVIYLLNRRLIRSYYRDLKAIEQRLARKSSSGQGTPIFSAQGYIFLIILEIALFLPYGYIEDVITLGTLASYVVFSAKFFILDMFLGAEFFLSMKQFLKARLFLMEEYKEKEKSKT